MLQKLAVIACIGIPCACVYLCSMRLTPQRGFLKVCEKVLIGIAVLYLCNLLLAPFFLPIAQNPLTSLAAGYLGLPGVALTLLVGHFL